MVKHQYFVYLLCACIVFTFKADRSGSHQIAGRVLPTRGSLSGFAHVSETSERNVAWLPSSWRNMPIAQAPDYHDETVVKETVHKLSKSPALVSEKEVYKLQEDLARVAEGKAFLLMGGDCAESFKEFSARYVQDTVRVILQMALVLTFGGSMPVIKVGRMAGQFAKPRSEPLETVGGITLPSYRGDIINSEAFTPEARTHNPTRMLDAYYQSAQTMNILRMCATASGCADLSKLLAANTAFARRFPSECKYKDMCEAIKISLDLSHTMGVDLESNPPIDPRVFTAHECLLLPYEEALTRRDSSGQGWCALSAHMLWIGERTRQLDHAHLHFVSGIINPVGIKLSERSDPEALLKMLGVVDPDNIPGRVVLIVRMGAEKIREKLPQLIRAVQREGRSVVWCSDPLHSNTIKTSSGYKTRPFHRICAEVQAFFDVHAELGTHPGGVHLEMTGADVTECMGGGVSTVLEEHLSRNYRTACDPRLNADQALELSFIIAEHMHKARSKEI